jgi:hypothetical protein
MSKKENLLTNIQAESDYHDSVEYVIIAVKRGSNEVWHSHQGDAMHLIQVLETSYESLKKQVMKGMLSQIKKLIDEVAEEEKLEADDPIKMDIAKAELETLLKNITKH